MRRILVAVVAVALLAALTTWLIPAQAQQPAPPPTWKQGQPSNLADSTLAPIPQPPAPMKANDIPVDKLKAPPGFKVELWAAELANARAMTWGDKGTLFVSSRVAGNVYAVVDKGGTREMYGSFLGYRGFGVFTAPDGNAGVDTAVAQRPDVIVMDLAMPWVDGITATRRLKADARTRNVPVILLTGHAYRAIDQGALEAGAAVFLTKPCLPEDLEAQIRRLQKRSSAVA